MLGHHRPPAVRQGDLTVVHLVGTLDGTRCANLRRTIDEEIKAGIKRFALNFQAVRHIDSAGIGELVGIQHRIEALGGRVVFTRVSEPLRKIFKVSNLDRVLHIVDDARRDEPGRDEGTVREIAVPLRRQIEGMWEVIRHGDDSSNSTLPEDVQEFWNDLLSHQQSLRENNRVLRDLLLSSDVDLDESEKRYQQLFENAADGIILIDANSTEILQVNRRIPLMTQLDRGDILGKPLQSLLPDLQNLSCDALLGKLREQAARSAETALNLRAGDGKTIPVSVTASVIGQGGESLLLHVHDISVFHSVEEELQRQVEDLTFLNKIEHQLASCDSVESLLREFQRQVHRLIGATESVMLEVDDESKRAIAVSAMERDTTGRGTPILNHRSANIDINQFTPMISERIEASLTKEHLTTLAMSRVIPKEWTSNEREWIVMTLNAGKDLKAIALLARNIETPWTERDVAQLSNLRTHLSLELQRLTTFAAVERAKRRYQKLFDCSSDAIAVVNLSTFRIEVANRRWAEICELPIEEIAGSSFLNAMCETEWKGICVNLQELAAKGEHTWENRLIEQEGEADRWVHVRGNIIDHDPVPKALVILIDITDQRNQKEEIQSLTRIVACDPHLVLRVGYNGKIQFANPAVTLFLDRCEGTSPKMENVIPSDMADRIGRLLDAGRITTSFEHTVAGRTLLYTLHIDEGDVVILHGVEITAQKELESAIANSEEANTRLVESALEGFTALRLGIMHTCNAALSRILGCSAHEIVGKPIREFIHPEDHFNFDIALERAEADPDCEVEVSLRMVGAEDDILVVTIAMRTGTIGGGPHILAYVRDETERHRLRERVQWLERLAVEGLVASDLTGADAADLVEVDIESTDPSATWPMPRGIIDLHMALRGVANRMEDLLGERGKLVIEDTANDAVARCTGQDLWHIVMCACSALHCLSEGPIGVSLSYVVLAGPELHRMPTARAGDNLSLDFTIGLPRHGAPSQAEAAFSMWLTMMEGTLHRLRSGLDVDHDETGVQRIRIFLPKADGLISDPVKVRSETKPATPESDEPPIQVLVVDDDVMVRDLITEILSDAGFEVIAACNGLEGVEKFTERPRDIQAVVLDIMMPVMDGHEAFRRMREVDPCVPILISSGFSNEIETRHLIECGRADFVGKPFRREVLIEKLNALMNAGDPIKIG